MRDEKFDFVFISWLILILYVFLFHHQIQINLFAQEIKKKAIPCTLYIYISLHITIESNVLTLSTAKNTYDQILKILNHRHRLIEYTQGILPKQYQHWIHSGNYNLEHTIQYYCKIRWLHAFICAMSNMNKNICIWSGAL